MSQNRPHIHEGKILPLTAKFGDAAAGTLAYHQVVGLAQAGTAEVGYGETNLLVTGNNAYIGYQKAYANDIVTKKVPMDIETVFNILAAADRDGCFADFTDARIAELQGRAPVSVPASISL